MLRSLSQAPPVRAPLLRAIGIAKRYGTFLANDSIDLDLLPAEIHPLLGENGAGKSTLVKIIYGLIRPSAGELRWRDARIEPAGPAQARKLGIGMVFQHFSLFESLTVAENVALGLPPTDSSFAAMSDRLAEVSGDYGLPLDPKREVWRLSVGERQRIEIVRALMQNPRLLILDEPTAVLTPQEANQLFSTLDRLKGEGRSILYISHKLEELQRLCDTATILRAGRKVATCDPRRETAASLARMIVGAGTGEVRAASDRRTGIPRLAVRDLTLEPDDPHGMRLCNVSLEVLGGENGGAVCPARQEPGRSLQGIFSRALDRDLLAAGNRREGGAAGDDRGGSLALLDRQCLEHRRRGPVPDRSGGRKLARGQDPRQRCRTLGAAGHDGAGRRRGRGRAQCAGPGDL